MKFQKFSIVKFVAFFFLFSLVSCEKELAIDNRDLDYGYVQFKLYKEASYQPTKAIISDLEYLGDAAKIKVSLSYGEELISQTLVLTAPEGAAEYGLRSDKLKLLAGEYRVVAFTLYDKLDEPLYQGGASSETFEVVPGGLEVHDLVASVIERGSVKFRFVKDLSDFQNIPTQASVQREYTFEEIEFVNVTVRNSAINETVVFKNLPAKYSTHFDEDDDTFGYQTASLECDTLLFLKGGKYELLSYETFNSSKVLLETNNYPADCEFIIEDNKTTEADIPLKLYESDEYIKDYYALYEIWKALDGENWYYWGENYPKGANWDFNKDPDMWGIQPGVSLHSNGRVSAIDISNFGFRGAIPAAIGQLTEVSVLYLGTHNDTNLLMYDPILDSDSADRMAKHSAYLHTIYPLTQMSEPIARALKEHKITIRETKLYDTMKESEIIDKKTGGQRSDIIQMDVVHGKLCNGLTSIDPAIGNLTKLEQLNIANSEITELPSTLANLTSCTDLEIYNCPNMKEFPMVIAEMPQLISLNLSNNKQWSEDEVLAGFKALATGASNDKIQILYFRENNLPEIPEEIRNMKSLGLIDFAYNNISKVALFGSDINPVQLYLDHNKITSLPRDEKGMFCGFDDFETFSAKNNKFTKFPDIFSAKSNFGITSIDFSYNEIDGFENEDNGYKGLIVKTLTLNNNPKLTKYPKCLAESNSQVSYISLRGCSISEIPKGSFTGENVIYLQSIDLSYNKLTDLPKEFHAGNIPYLYGVELSYNSFSSFPWEPLDCSGLTVFAIRGQRDENGKRCLKEWPTGIYQHTGLRAFYIGSNDLGVIDDTISFMIYYLEISDNPNIVFDASDICYYYARGQYFLLYDKSQNILNCEYM